MFHIKLYNPISAQLETIANLTEPEESAAFAEARQFLLSRGARIGEFVRDGEERGRSVYGFLDQSSVASDFGGHACLTNTTYFLFKYIREDMKLPVRSFIDLGCGAGNVLISAATLLDAEKATGVEIDPELARQARENTYGLNAEIIEADLFTWTPEVNDFDLVYLFEPVREERRIEFFAHLATWLRDGQHVFYQHTEGALPRWLNGIELPNHNRTCLFTFDKTKV